jgi:hypothetical protein
MQKLIFFSFLMIISWSISAQDNTFKLDDLIVEQSFEAKLTGIVINPDVLVNEKFITKNWCPSEITLYNDEIIYNKKLLYSGFDDAFIWLEPTANMYTQLERDLIKEVRMKLNSNNEYLVFRSFRVKQLMQSNSKNVFLNVLVDGKISLYIYRKIQFYNNTDYEPNYKYFLKKQDGQFDIFRPNKVGLLAQFPEKKKELRKIIKKNRLSIKKEADLKKAIELLNLEI